MANFFDYPFFVPMSKKPTSYQKIYINQINGKIRRLEIDQKHKGKKKTHFVRNNLTKRQAQTILKKHNKSMKQFFNRGKN